MPDELFLIDGNSLVYRAFFALPESIATSTGHPTNAIFGFASMLVKILTDYGPKATLVVWDAGSSGRKEVYADYKAQRTSRPDLLKEQWPHLEPLVEAFGYRNLAVEGYEADDVIASIVEQARHSKLLATIKRDIPLDLDVSAFTSQPPDRSRLRDVFREFELREPLRRLEEALGSADAAAPAPAAEQALTATVVEATLAELDSKLPRSEVSLAVTA